MTVGGCAGVGQRASARASGQTPNLPPGSCAAITTGALRSVAQRIYAQAAGGRNVAGARRRLARSVALAGAVARGDAKATRAALKPLLRSQIHRIVVTTGGGRVLATFGRSPALAPVRGAVRDAAGRLVGRYTLSVAGQASIRGVIASTTGARVEIAHGVPADSTVSVPAVAFPRGRLRIGLRIPAGDLRTCGPTRAATVAATDLAIARRLFRAERSGPEARRVLRTVAADRQIRRAAQTDDAALLRTAIIRFFRTPWMHVVRIRTTDAAGRLVGDVGGPYVLAPASAPIKGPGGAWIGRVTLSVQDDAGYIKLLHRFTGATVQLRSPAGIVPGSGAIAAAAGSDRVVAFDARAFPSGPLRVTLRVPA